MTHLWKMVKLQFQAMNCVQNGPTLMVHAPGIQARHKWGECVFFKEIQFIQQSPLTFDPFSFNDDQFWTTKDPQAKLLRWHHWLGNVVSRCWRNLPNAGRFHDLLPRFNHQSTGCLFGAITKKKRWTKGASNKPIKIATALSECISVNRIIYTQIGFILQLKDWLTNNNTGPLLFLLNTSLDYVTFIFMNHCHQKK